MTVWPTHWPPTARAIGDGTDAALAAAAAHRSDPFDEAVAHLLALPFEVVTKVHAAMINELLEDHYPGGLTLEAVQQVLQDSVRCALEWTTDVAPEAMADALSGTLGIADTQPGTRQEYLRAGLLVLTSLTSGRRASPYLRRALAEIERGETIELP